MSPQRGRPSGSAVRNRLPGGIPSRRQEEPHGLDLHHMLSAVVGAYVGLVFYSLITPGQIPHEPPLPSPDSKMTVGDPVPRQSICIRRPPISTILPRGG